MTLNEQNGFIKNTGTMILSYTVLFAVLIAGVFSTFYLQHKCLMNIYDAYDQGYFWTVELKKNLSSLMAGNGFPEWSWSKGPGMEVKAITDPFMVLAALFPIGHIELGYSVVTILRLYVSGLAFMAFAREVEIARYQAVMGAICYTFSAWIINVSLVQSQFVNITILFPLLIMSVDRVYKGKSSVPFMILVALTMINSVYLAYMAGLSAVLYILLRYFNYCEKFSIKEYVVSVLKFIVYGLIGMAASAVITMTTIQSLMGASTGGGSGKAYDTFAGMSFVFNLGNKFVSEGYDFGYGYIGLPILALMVIAVSYRYFSLRNTQLIMTAIFVIMTPFPFFSSMFNGFGYVTTRWYFMLIFFLVWTATENFDLDRLAEIKNLIIMFIWMAIITVSTLGFAYLDITENYSRNDILFVAGSLAAGYLMLVIIATGIKGKTPLKFRQGAITLITVGAIACLWTISFQGSMDTFVKDNEINAQLEASTQR
ncbi:MAG: YfhO family protein, partial [Eubacterium sp.]|nr:YfhO family protein [Candidatus Colimonas fimequi]